MKFADCCGRISLSVLLFLSVFVLFGSAQGENGSAYSPYYPADYNILNGTYVSGSLPASVQTVDTDYLIIQSAATNPTALTYPSGYYLGGSTSWVAGSLSSLSSEDGVYMTFQSYSSVRSQLEFVGNLSDVDASTDKGTHGNFTAQQAGPDSNCDALVEESNGTTNYELDLEVQWTNADYDEANEELAIYIDKGNTFSLDATGGYMIVGDGTPDWGSTTGTISFWVKMDTAVQGRFWGQNGNMETRWSGTNLLLDWGGSNSTTSAYSFSADAWYFVAIAWNETGNDLFLYIGDENNPPTLDANSLTGSWTGTTPAPTENRFLNGLGSSQPVNGHGDDLRYWNTTRTLAEIQSDYNVELKGSEANLRSYFKLNNNFDDIGPDNNDGSGTGSYSFSSDVAFEAPPSENLRIDVWNGFTWQNLFTNLQDRWNNISVSSYLDSSTFTIRFKGGNETGDTIRNSWNIDVTMLHTWSNEYSTEVEFVGSSDPENWSRITWTVECAWTNSSISVTLQLFNYSLGEYSSDGNGYSNYMSSLTAGEDDRQTQSITINPDHFLNSTGYWKMRIKGLKTTDISFESRVDWIELRFSGKHLVSTEFLFSSLTTNTPSQLNFTIVSQSSIADVNITIQVWNYSSSSYSMRGEAHSQYTSNTPNQTGTLSINTNPQFYVSNGNARIRITGLATTTEYQLETNQARLLYRYLTPSFDWIIPFLYALPLIFGLLLIPVLRLKRKKRTKPVSPRATIEDKTYPFSGSFGITHEEMMGKKILLEIDPTSNYQKALSAFVSEARNSGEKIFVFTGANSPLHSASPKSKRAKFFILTSEASSAQTVNKKETLLPASDLSVILNAFVRIQKAKRRKPISILFDNLSDTILLCGFEKTYKFIRWLLEAASSPKTTALFIFNPTAHDPMTSSSIRALFQVRFAYSKSGLKAGTL